jgi:hypothetical protein
LGDWHGFLTVGDRTAYSGTPEVDRFGRDEPGGCIVVEARSGEAPGCGALRRDGIVGCRGSGTWSGWRIWIARSRR